MLLTVVRDRRVPAYPDLPGRPAGERAYVLPASNALTRTYRTDSHFMAYASPVNRRLKRDSLAAGIEVRMTAIALDVDCPEVHGFPVPAPDKWRTNMRIKMSYLHNVHPGCFYYETRGGCRIVYGVNETIIRNKADEAAWSQNYAIALAYLARRFSIVADQSCADWTRLLRCPRATRDIGGKPEAWEMIGDPADIQPLVFTPSPDDVATAKKTSKAFTESKQHTFVPPIVGGEGLLFRLVSARGGIIGTHASGAWVAVCPNVGQHTSGRDGDGSTLLYPPSQGHKVGAIACLHGHCAGLRVSDWIKLFTRQELDAAESRNR